MSAKRYHGKPCKRCGSTEKYTSSYSCVKCQCERSHTHKRVSPYAPEVLDKKRRAVREWYARQSREFIRAKNREHKHGVSVERFTALWDAQAGVCPGCAQALANDRFTHIDHDHATGEVRGLLCHYCNTALGLVKDSVETLLRLGMYLEKHR